MYLSITGVTADKKLAKYQLFDLEAGTVLTHSGIKSLSAELTQIAIAPDANNFNGGAINIMYQ